VTSVCTGEDETSIARHVKTMQDEMKRSVKNDTILDDRMIRTMSARRADVAVKSLSDILATYPALQLDLQASSFDGTFCIIIDGLPSYRCSYLNHMHLLFMS